jgi:photosystem II stability/assembly factor-like uncharacterized protein
MINTMNHIKRSVILVITAAAFFLLPFAFTSASGQTASNASKPAPPRIAALPRAEPEEDESEIIEARLRYFRQRHGNISPELRLRLVREEYQKIEAEKARRLLQPSVDPAWVVVGPTNGAGRMTAIAPHPTVMGTLYAGADGGGVWKTTDAGNSWVTLTDSINNLKVGALAVAPSSPSTIYLGTGSEHGRGIGLLKSTDAGATWIFPATVVANRFFRISVHPTNPNDLVIGTDFGGLRSTDGGTTWTTVLSNQLYGIDIVRDPTNSQILYAAAIGCDSICGGQVRKSTDGGATWVLKSSGLVGQGASYMAIAINPSNPLVLYTSFSAYDNGNTVSHIYKTTDGAESWSDLTGVSGEPSVNNYMGFQAYHDNTIIVSPTNPNVVIAGGIFYIRSTNGGTTWAIPPFTGDGVHADATDLRYQGSTIYIANDGGIWSTSDNGETAVARNAGLATREYYAMTNDEVNRNRIFAGSQDNGTDRHLDSGGTAWVNVFGGDGFDCAVSPNVPSIAYWSIQYGLLFRTKDAANASTSTFANAVEPFYPTGEQADFGTLLTMDTSKPSTLYTGTYRVWRTTDGGDSWIPLPTTTTDGSFWTHSYSDISAIAVSRNNSALLLVSKRNGGTVFRSTNGGTSWTRSENGFLSANNLEIDPNNSTIAYAAVLDYSGNSVYMSTNGGISWAPRGTGLPSFPAQVVRVNPSDSNILYCGTDAGVYRSTDQGLTWARYGTGLPSVDIDDLRILEDGSLLRVATYGRGVWEIQFPTGNTPPSAVITSPTTPLRVIKGTPITFQGSVSDSDSGDAATGIWTFTDTGETVSVGSGTSNTSHTFNRAGKFPVALIAKDSHRARGAASVIINVYEPFDSCATPMVISGNGPFPVSITTNNETATTEASDPSPSCFGLSSSLWFEFTPQVTGTYQFSVERRAFNLVTGLSIWTGPKCGPYTAVPDSCQYGQVSVAAQAGVTLRILLDGLTPDAGRIFTLTVTSLPITCAYALSPANQSFTARGGSGSVNIAAPADCNWNAVSNDIGFIMVNSGNSGTGNGTVHYSVFNNAGHARTGTMTIGGQTFTVEQRGNQSKPSDFDGDTHTDVSVWRPSSGVWFITNSSNASTRVVGWGLNGDQIVPGDYDVDGQTDIAIWRPSTGVWFIINSSDGSTRTVGWGVNGDVPVPGDYDGDGQTDIAVWRPSSGQWFIINSSNGSVTIVSWGVNGDLPVPRDYDGDAKTDMAVWRPSTGVWFIINSSNGSTRAVGWGVSGDKMVPADYDGDGKADIAIWRPSTGVWFIINSSDSSIKTLGWGVSSDVPILGDYDGDGRTDIAVWRPSSGTWFIINSSTSSPSTVVWGTSGDLPVPSAFVRP